MNVGAAEQARRLIERWHDDPVLFAEEVLGIRIWSRQAEVLNAVARHDRVAVRSGHKTGKSKGVGALAFWWAMTRVEGRVIMTSSGNRQVKSILWREIKTIHRRARVPLGGKLNEDPATGLQFGDGREIIGFTTKEKEKMAGFSGQNLLFIVDEASGVPQEIFEAIDGNRAGGAKIVLLSNPTQVSGEFYDAFHDKTDLYFPIHIRSDETPNCVEGRIVVPGLATLQWIEEKRVEYGPDYENDPFYQVRVLGDFPSQSERSVIALSLVAKAIDDWEDAEEDGPLELGVDVARFGDDDSVICSRRGKKALGFRAVHGMDTQQVANEVRAEVRERRKPRDGAKVRVKVDVIGIGAGVADELKKDADIEVIEVNVSESGWATDNEGRQKYVKVRDQIWFATRDWLKEGGAIPNDKLLRGELVAPSYSFDSQGRQKVEAKDEIKKRLGRSPDRADALGMAIFNAPLPEEWEPAFGASRWN
jgi:hypothetical protein